MVSFISIQSPLVIKPLSEKITHSGKCELLMNKIIHASLQAPLIDTIRNTSAEGQDAPIAGAFSLSSSHWDYTAYCSVFSNISLAVRYGSIQRSIITLEHEWII